MSKMKLTDWVGYICVKLYKPFSRRPLNVFLAQELDKITAEISPSQDTIIRVLNIGSGGDIYKLLKKNPYIKIDQLDVDPARQPDIVADASDMNMISAETYDFVFAMEVLEHIPTPQAAIDEIFRVLKQDGKFIFSTPFMFPIHDEPHDYYRYTHYGLRYLLRAFEIQSLKARNNYLQAVVLLLLRTIVIGNKKQRLASAFIYITTILTYPLWLLLSRIFDSELATTGYCGVATKQKNMSND